MSSGDSSKIRDFRNGPNGEPLVNETIVDEHVSHAKHRNSEALHMENCQLTMHS